MKNDKKLINIRRVSLTKIQKEVLIGILLGDANLQTFNQGRTFRLRYIQSLKHKDYLLNVYNVFKNLVSTEPKIYFDGSNYKIYFNTLTFSCFRFYGQQFYKEGKKCVPKILSKLLTVRSLAFWYMDDGAQKWKHKVKAVVLCTDCFKKVEVLFLLELLLKKFNIKASLQKNRKNFRLYIGAQSYMHFFYLINVFVYPCMSYKLPNPNN